MVFVAYTTIQISPKTREILSFLKESKRETYDDLINKLVSLIPDGDDEGKYSRNFRVGLLNAKLDFKKGELFSFSDVKKSFGVD